MPLRIWKNKKTNEIKKSLKDNMDTEEWEEVITAPSAKYMEVANEATGRSKLKGLKEELAKRARRHSTAVELNERIALQKDSGMGESPTMINEKGERRKNIDDL